MSNVTTAPGTIVLVPGDRFFLKEVAIDSATSTAGQVEIALEESSPFPLAQMYHGFVTSTDGRQALAYAAYRRRFTPEEIAEWSEAVMVLPDFLALLGSTPTAEQISAVASATGHRPDGTVSAGLTSEGGVVFRVGDQETCRLPASAVATADVRDKEFLDTRQREGRRRRGWWTALLAVAALWVLAAGVEIANAVLGMRAKQDAASVTQRAEEVARIETAETVAKRVEDLTARPERPFEWLAAASAARPRSVQFLRTASRGDRTLEIEAQTADASDAGVYEASLRQLPQVERVETRELRSREGMTSFVMAVKFKSTAPATPATGGTR